MDATTYATHGGPLDAMLAASAASDLLAVGYSPHERLSRVLNLVASDALTSDPEWMVWETAATD